LAPFRALRGKRELEQLTHRRNRVGMSNNSKHVYLAGAIEYAPGGGKEWRREIGRFLTQDLGIPVFDPCTNEMDLLTPEEKDQFRAWKTCAPQRFTSTVQKIIDHDLTNLLEHTCFIVCLWDEYCTKGAGTAGELTLAYWHGVPAYVVLGMPRDRVSSWALGCATEVFDSFEALKEFLNANHRKCSS
jgi:hypothetical protein